MVLIKDDEYLDTKKAIIDRDEYKETIKHLPRIVKEVDDYITTYVSHVDGTMPLHPKEYARKYRFSTLPYFHDILKIYP